MNRAVKAALLSGLVFPGAGQLFLGKRLRGWLFVLPALAAAAYFLVQVIEPAMAIALDIGAGSMPLDPLAITAKVRQVAPAETPLMRLAAGVMIACWGASTLDAYRLGRT